MIVRLRPFTVQKYSLLSDGYLKKRFGNGRINGAATKPKATTVTELPENNYGGGAATGGQAGLQIRAAALTLSPVGSIPTRSPQKTTPGRAPGVFNVRPEGPP